MTLRTATSRRRTAHQPVFGAIPIVSGVRFRLCAPNAKHVRLLLRQHGRAACTFDLSPTVAAGVWEITVEQANTGDRYAYAVDEDEPRPSLEHDDVFRNAPDHEDDHFRTPPA